MSTKPSPHTQYESLYKAFNFYNKELFSNTLPDCLITLGRTRHSMGHFGSNFWNNENDTREHEINLNPDFVKKSNLVDVLSTLTHEMVHLWQFVHGNPGKNGYHNIEWVLAMIHIGLLPFNQSNSELRTGTNVSHKIESCGMFDRKTDELLKNGFSIPLETNGTQALEKEKNKQQNKTKYTCPGCATNVWGKPKLAIVCVPCSLEYMETT